MIRKQPSKTVAVVGLGYVGLPLALLAAGRGWRVFGYDTDVRKVALINGGRSPWYDSRLSADLKRHHVTASTDPSIVENARIIVIAVPTPVTGRHRPDLRPLRQALRSIMPFLSSGQTLIVESTINPGVMDEVVLPLIRRRPALRVHLAHCPERINPGDPIWSVRTIPRVLGAYGTPALKAAKNFYQSILDAPIKLMADVKEAEAVKILENTFRDVNIAFVNEMAQSLDRLNIDIMQVIAGAATKPFAFLPHYPGNGVGGHCISVDPYYMIERAKQAGFNHQFLKLARRINDHMPGYTIRLLRRGLRRLGLSYKRTPVALLGVTYKRDVADVRESPALAALRLLRKGRHQVRVYDPLVPSLSTVSSFSAAINGCPAVMLATDHTVLCKNLTSKRLARSGVQLVIDGKNALDANALARAGILYYGVGRSRFPESF